MGDARGAPIRGEAFGGRGAPHASRHCTSRKSPLSRRAASFPGSGVRAAGVARSLGRPAGSMASQPSPPADRSPPAIPDRTGKHLAISSKFDAVRHTGSLTRRSRHIYFLAGLQKQGARLRILTSPERACLPTRRTTVAFLQVCSSVEACLRQRPLKHPDHVRDR